MNARKDRLKSLFAGEPVDDGTASAPAAGASPGAPPAPASPAGEAPSRHVPSGTLPSASTPTGAGPAEPPRRATSAAVKAMGLSLGTLSQEADEARRLREALAAGETIVEIDTALIERSPFIDRLSEGARDDEEFSALVESIGAHGQQVPILVRPHGDADKAARGLFQIAYGHRRVAAARALGRKVRALVRMLDDAALALAQGKENAERRALSFIERALFAQQLIDHGFERATVQAALAVHKSEMSRLLQVAEAIPREVATAIGPAPKAGRPRWQELGELIALDKSGHAQSEMATPAFAEADSDARFQRLFNRLKSSAQTRGAAAARKRVRKISGAGGKPIGEIVQAARGARLTVPESAGAGFADYVAGQLPQLHAAFEKMKKEAERDR
jgi:ParB family transcriptional regulator, chromosome partitioning protein